MRKLEMIFKVVTIGISMLVLTWILVSYINVICNNTPPVVYDYPSWNFFKVAF